MSGGVGNDTQHGNGGDDRIFANQGADTTFGGEGNDRLFALSQRDLDREGVDKVYGEGGDDRIRTRDGEADIVNCGDGNDVAQLDDLDIIEDATQQAPNGSCERVVRRAPRPGDSRQEDRTERPREDPSASRR
jgi:Ca2+-binding RTX toxin-like protein